MFCIHCGKELPEGAKFCIFCGKAAVVSESPVPSQAPEQEVSAPTSPVEDPVTVPPSTEDTTKVSLMENSPESSVALESKLQPEEEASAVASRKTADCQVTFMRWDTSGPELTITFAQGEPLTISSYESRTVILPGGKQHISLDTSSKHTECDLMLDGDSKVNLRWDEENHLFYVECNARGNFKASTHPKTSAPEPARPEPAPTTTAANSSTPQSKSGINGLVIGLGIALVAVLVLVGAFFAFRDKPVTGVWKFDHSIVEGTRMSAADLGNDMYIYLSDNGLAEVTVDYGTVEREQGKWELIDSKTLLLTLTSTREEILFSRSRNTLSAPYDGATIYFTRSNLSPNQIPTPSLAVGAGNTQEFTEPPVPTPTPIQPTIQYTFVSVQELYDALHSNALRANDTYLDMYIVAVGVLGGIDNDGKYFTIHDPYDDSIWTDDLHCDITTEDQRKTLMNLDSGDIVTVRGKITTVGEVMGYLMDIDQLEYGDTTYYEGTDDSYGEELDYSWLEGEYEKAHDVDITMVLDVDDLITTEIYVRFLRYNPSGDTEVLGEGPASYVRGGESPRFEGYLYNDTMDPITIEYDENSYNFTVDCSALGFFGDTFTDLF